VRALPPSILHARPRLSSAVFGPVAPVSVRVTLPTEEEIRARLGHLATRNGDVCQRDGRVMIRTRSEDGATLRAEVQGARRRPHAVTVTIAWRPRLDIAGRCDCPAGTGCEHVAAVLLEAVRAGFSPAYASEAYLFQFSQQAGKPLAELESIELQLGLFDSAPPALQLHDPGVYDCSPDELPADIVSRVAVWYSRTPAYATVIEDAIAGEVRW
jgi:hypothetical protein